MILYDLICDKDHAFESWFRNSAAADKLLKAGQSPCPNCGSVKVRKAPMAPRLSKGAGKERGEEASAAPAASVPAVKAPAAPPVVNGEVAAAMEEATQALAKLRDTIEKNFDNVGNQFPEEARRIHYGEARERPIYGDATLE